jgi:hypothetical protein
MPKQPKQPKPKVAAYDRVRKLWTYPRAEAEAAPILEEPPIFSFVAFGGGRRGSATAFLIPVVGGELGGMVAQGAAELGAKAAEAVAEGVEGITEAAEQRAERRKGGETHAYRGSRFLRVTYGRRYFVMVTASKVGIFRSTLTPTAKWPLVIIPREAIRSAEFHDGFWNFLLSWVHVIPVGPQVRKLTFTLDDGGRLHFWVDRWGKSARTIADLITSTFPRAEPAKVGEHNLVSTPSRT